MNSAFIALPVVASIGLILWAALFVGSRLIRRRENSFAASSPRTARSRFLRDLEPLEDLLVAFVAQTPEFARVLKLLARHDKPLPFAQIVHELRISRNGSTRLNTVASLTGMALISLHLIGLVRLQRSGFVATIIGREVQQRISTGNPLRTSTVPARTNTANRPYTPLSVGKHPADNHGISWSASLPGIRPQAHQPRLTNIGALRQPSASVAPASLVQRTTKILTKETNKMNHENNIIVTAPDHAELSSVITVTGKVSERAKWELRLLENELKRAQIVPPEEIPPDVITMNTRAELLDLDSGEEMEFTLVLPADADINDGKISVLAPLGTAMLGYRIGDTFEWPVPYGVRRLKVIKVHFQPERSLKQAA
jgi:regulator of nucleoside diphosphate kinase